MGVYQRRGVHPTVRRRRSLQDIRSVRRWPLWVRNAVCVAPEAAEGHRRTICERRADLSTLEVTVVDHEARLAEIEQRLGEKRGWFERFTG
jgi:hypothetical protein